ncbi:MAG: phosphate acyltransferase PlsX [Chitinophagaceae bacterium]|jgi:glycerol-3-phosphate acyltransferase PlsX|nr:MAG: phosphate acyltransferase PlsX [Chitinophagaceae bacterium]
MKIGIDMMGGDFAPAEAVKGVKQFLDNTSSDTELVLIGDKTCIHPLLDGTTTDSSRFTIFHAPEVIGMHEHPTKALKNKPHSSINAGFKILAEEGIDTFISAGNTGAMMVGALYSIKTIDGIQRPTISTTLPRQNGTTGLLLDVGINSDCKPENLLQFAILGSLYSKNILHIDNPRVALLNIGEEEGKGNLLAQAAYPVLRDNSKINFIGNIEGRDIFTEKADVIVCDGFTGNVVLKLAESFYDIALSRNIQDDFLLKNFNFETYGGTPVLGIAKPVIIGHGISKASAFKNMITLAQLMLESQLLDKIRENFNS